MIWGTVRYNAGLETALHWSILKSPYCVRGGFPAGAV
jgi:hypothetical protein